DDHPFEAVAAYLWSGAMPAHENGWHNGATAFPVDAEFAKASGLQLCPLLTQSVLALGKVKPQDVRPQDRRLDDCALAPVLIRARGGTFGLLGPAGAFMPFEDRETIAHGLARALGLPTHRDNLRALNAALVLVADHELTPATFVGRIAASVGS